MNKLRLKYITILLVVIAALILIAAYRVQMYKTDNKNSTKDNKKIIVGVWLKPENDTETRRYQVDMFNKENRDISISLKTDFQANSNDYNNQLKLVLSSGDKPDIFQYSSRDILKNNYTLDLRDISLDSEFPKGSLMYYNEQPLGVKATGNTVKFAWNREIFQGAGLNPDLAPKTWSELVEYADKIKKVYPDVIPFEFPTYTLNEMKMSIGEPSVGQGPIYTSFWNFKEGKYDFKYAENILNIYNKLYSNGLIDKNNFDNKNRADLRKDFISKKTAIIISTSEDKYYFTSIMPVDFSVGISNLPKINIGDSETYYYNDFYNCLMINKHVKASDKNYVEAVKKVYQWFLSDKVNKQLLSTKRALPILVPDYFQEKNDIYEKYNDKTNYKNETYDPTYYIDFSAAETMRLYTEAISGKIPVKESINQLNKLYESDCEYTKNEEGFDFSKYIEK